MLEESKQPPCYHRQKTSQLSSPKSNSYSIYVRTVYESIQTTDHLDEAFSPDQKESLSRMSCSSIFLQEGCCSNQLVSSLNYFHAEKRTIYNDLFYLFNMFSFRLETFPRVSPEHLVLKFYV